MKDFWRENGGCLIAGAAWLVFMLWILSPASDQVCRAHKTPILDSFYGVDGQPTCNALIDQLDARIAEQATTAEDLDSRVSDLEAKLDK